MGPSALQVYSQLGFSHNTFLQIVIAPSFQRWHAYVQQTKMDPSLVPSAASLSECMYWGSNLKLNTDSIDQCYVTNSLFFMHSINVWKRWMASLWLKLKVFLIVAMMSASTPSGSPLKGNTPCQTLFILFIFTTKTT